ncbi:MAG: hypothetical protein Fur0018_11500 [Anaerolineales bacterium]
MIFLFWGLSACQQRPDAAPPTVTAPQSEVRPTPSPTAPFQTRQSVLPQSSGGAPQGNPILLVFPSPAPPPEAAWRPPLYPVPWALRPQDHFFFTRPIPVDKPNWPLASYRYGGVFFEDVVHSGVDIPSPTGTDVIATGPGVVVWAGYGLFSFTPGNESDPYGMAVAIRHDFGYQNQPLYTLYAHMSQIAVIEGQRVATGEKIGEVGETGFTTGPHLHFEVRIGQNSFFTTRNPELWIAPPQGWGVLAGRITDEFGEPLIHAQMALTHLESRHTWLVMTYGKGVVQSDPFYQENMVIGDLPAGTYRLEIVYNEEKFTHTMEILPGIVNYVRFEGKDGFTTDAPPTPTSATPAPLDR